MVLDDASVQQVFKSRMNGHAVDELTGHIERVALHPVERTRTSGAVTFRSVVPS